MNELGLIMIQAFNAFKDLQTTTMTIDQFYDHVGRNGIKFTILESCPNARRRKNK